MKHIITTFISVFLISGMLMAQGSQIKITSADQNDLQMVSKAQTGFQVKSTLADMEYIVVKTEQGSFMQIRIPGYTKNFEVGTPELPMLKRLIEIPHGADVSVNIISYDEEIINLDDMGIPFKVFPVQPPVKKSADPSEIIFEYDEDYYSVDAFNKRPVAEVTTLGIMRGVQMGRLEIAPFRYNPVTNELKVLNNIEVEVTFNNADFAKTAFEKERLYSPAFNTSFSKFLNYEPIANKDDITSYPIKFVIVADPMFETQLQPYIEWKTRKGFNVIEAYTDDGAVGSTTTSITNYLENLYTSGTPSDPAPTYVLFVGDEAQVPAYSGSGHITDLYYVTYDGGGDIYPDVYYGRFSAQNTAQLQPQIDKTLEYEQYLFPDPSFLDHVVLVSGVDGSYAAVHGNGQINYGTDVYFNTAHGITDHTWLYPASDGAGVSNAIISQVNLGCSFMNYTAHCYEAGWGDPSFEVSDVNNMSNASMYPLSVGNCCLSNEFSTNACFGEALLRATNKGAIGHIGGSNSTYWDEDFWWGVGSMPSGSITANPTYAGSGLGAYDCLFHDHGEPESDWFITQDQVLHSGNLAVTEAGGNETYYWEIYHLMGDPSVMTYITVPPALTYSYMDPIPVGTTTLDVTTEQYAYVAISQNNVLLDAKYTGSGTTVTLEFPAFTMAGTADLVITKQFRQPYIGTVDIVSANTDNDAQLAAITIPEENHSIMAADVNPTFTIRNLGNDNLTAVEVGYEIDGGTITSQSWTGNLAQYETDVVSFPLITLPSGTHTITAFVSWPNGVVDEFHPGDTLSKEFNVTAGDAAVVGIYDFLAVYCSAETITPTVTISNKGDVDLLSVDVNYQIDAGTIQTINWTGSLAPNDEEVVTFPAIMLAPGDHTFTGFTSNPNGGADENTTNDQMSVDYSVFSSAQSVEIAIQTDDYGSETTWELTDDDSGAVLYSGGPYADWSPELFTEEFCLGDGCYTFTIYDSYGDGQDGWTTDGSYTVTNTSTTEEYGTGSGNWGENASVNFCIDLVSVDEVESTMFAVYPNPSNGEFTVQSGRTIETIRVVNILGEELMNINANSTLRNIDLSRFGSGVYYIIASVNGEKITQKVILSK